jgi:hypothetical protein
VGAANALDEERDRRRADDGAPAALDTRRLLAPTGAADARDEEDDDATAALDTHRQLAPTSARPTRAMRTRPPPR